MARLNFSKEREITRRRYKSHLKWYSVDSESSDTDIINYYSNLSSQIQNATNGVSTRIANGFFLNKQFAISDQYRGDIAKKYAALIQSVDFTNQQQAAETINTFVNETTAGKIEEIVKAEELKDPFSIIVNAIYFNAEWEIKFDSNRNSLGTFHTTPEKGREITIPKIKIETDFKLKKALVAMGATEMFTANADLSGIVKAPPLYVSKAAHKAIIEVDEAGTTAAAATMMEIMETASLETNEAKRFVADHPFLFALTKDKNPLFVGQVPRRFQKSWSEEENLGYDARSGRPSEIDNGLLRAIIGADSVLKTREDADEENVKYSSVVCHSKESGR
ncbi:hypothetical protein RB195_015705 [Necator americanus]|uniref:Serpin domain-containing protein n=1 Tax=Necator americanus TaxID=51031 RepID=A0ABR1E631_NECAM